MKGDDYLKKYYLDFDPFNEDVFVLLTCNNHDVIFTGNISEIIGTDTDDPWDVLDKYFEKELNIKSEEWTVG